VRAKLDALDEGYEHGYEVGDFVLTFQFFEAPAPDEQLVPWAGGAYPGWGRNAATVGSSPAYWVDEGILRDALRYTRQMVRDTEFRGAELDDDDAAEPDQENDA
jgi:hypothetical protein